MDYTILYVQIIGLLIAFCVASYQDIRERMVSDMIWYITFIFETIVHIIAIHFNDVSFYSWTNVLINTIIGLIIIACFIAPKLIGKKEIMGIADLFAIFIFSYSIPGYYPWIVSSYYDKIPIPFSVIINFFIIFVLYVLFKLTVITKNEKGSDINSKNINKKAELLSYDYPLILFFLIGIILTILIGNIF